MTETDTCRCGRPTRDAHYFCDDCGQTLSVALGDVPWLNEELDTTITRAKGIDYRRVGGGKGGKKPAEMPAPANMGASEAKTQLRDLLASWVLFAHETSVRNSSPHTGLPDLDLTAMSRWLMWRVDGFALLDIGPEIVDEITDAVARCHRVIDRPGDRQYLGGCSECETGRLYARRGGTWARCDACDATEDAEGRRKGLLDELDDRLCTAAEIAHLSTYLGLRADREQVRKRINTWHTRKRIHSEHAFSDDPVFRFGIVWRLLVQDESKTSDSVA